MKLTGKVALVTGGSRGIGFAIAKTLSENGASVVITSKDSEKIKKAESKIPNSLGISCDIKKKNEVIDVVNQTIEKFGKLDILVNNAGIFPKIKQLHEIEEEEYKTSEGLVINVPLCADEKKYEVLVLVDYNAFEQEEQKHFITVTKNDACNADSSLTGVKSFNAQAVVGSANSIAGNKVSFPVILSNPSDNSKTVILSPQGADDLGNVKVSPNWVVDLAPFSTMTAYVEVTPANNVAEGEHSFTISATDGTNTKLLNFAVNVKPGSASTASSSSNWVLISVVIVAVLLIIIIIIVLFNKMNNDDEDEEDYY